VKDEREKSFPYSFHTACDAHGFVLAANVTGANVHASRMLDQILDKVIEKIEKPVAVAVDAGYKTPYIAKYLMDQGIRPVMPYTRPLTKKDYFKKHEFTYDEHFDCYICPEGQVLSYRTTTCEGYRQYASKPIHCQNCPSLSSCTQSQNNMKMIHRHVWEGYIEETDHLRHTKKTKRYIENAKKQLNGSLRMPKKSMVCVGQPFRDLKNCPCRRC
jgi:hypothetical protein